jgi:hypothetical protein
MKLYEKSNSFLNPPFFISMTTAAKLVQPIAIFLAYKFKMKLPWKPRYQNNGVG